MSETADIRIESFGLDRDTIHRWRKRLEVPKKFDEALEAAQERCVKVCEAHRAAAVPTSLLVPSR